jgi:hypothetical protein
MTINPEIEGSNQARSAIQKQEKMFEKTVRKTFK